MTAIKAPPFPKTINGTFTDGMEDPRILLMPSFAQPRGCAAPWISSYHKPIHTATSLLREVANRIK